MKRTSLIHKFARLFGNFALLEVITQQEPVLKKDMPKRCERTLDIQIQDLLCVSNFGE